MTDTEIVENRIRAAIDSISESIRINGCESDTTEFLVNFLTGNVPMIADMIMEDEQEAALPLAELEA